FRIAILSLGNALPGSSIAILRLGIALLGLGIAIPRPSIAIPRPCSVILRPCSVIHGLGIAIPRPCIALPSLGIALPEPCITIPRPCIALPEPCIALPGSKIAIPKADSPTLSPRPGIPGREPQCPLAHVLAPDGDGEQSCQHGAEHGFERDVASRGGPCRAVS